MIRIGTQNLGLDDAASAAYLVDDIFDRYTLDVLALQEVYRWPKDSKTDLVAIMQWGFASRYAEEMYYHEGPALTWMINMTISRYPIRQAVTVKVEDRHLLHTQIATPEGDLHVFNFHAKRDGGGDRNACRYNRAALAYMGRVVRPGEAGYLVGDLNQKAEEVMQCGGEGVIRRNAPGYEYSDFFASIHAPRVVSVSAEGNAYGLRDAHILTVATVGASKMHDVFMPIISDNGFA